MGGKLWMIKSYDGRNQYYTADRQDAEDMYRYRCLTSKGDVQMYCGTPGRYETVMEYKADRRRRAYNG